MPRLFTSASSQFLEKSVQIVTAYPMTVSYWFNPTSSAAVCTQLGIANNAAATAYVAVGVTGAGKPFIEVDTAGTTTDAIHGTSVTNGQWGHHLAVLTSITSRTIYFNGLNPVTDATSSAWPAAMNVTDIGALPISARGSFSNGIIAYMGIWTAALGIDEIKALVSGVQPIYIRPASRVSNTPIWNQSPETDMDSNTGWTVTGATNSTNLPPVSTTHGYRGATLRPHPFSPGLAR